jgi:hypothetical protein
MKVEVYMLLFNQKIKMNSESGIGKEYKKDQSVKGENKIMNKGIMILLIAAIVDWELFQWLYTSLQVKH